MAYMDLLPEAAKIGRGPRLPARDVKAGGPPPSSVEADVDAEAAYGGNGGRCALGNVEKLMGDNPWMAGPAFTMAFTHIAFTPWITNLALRGYAMPLAPTRIPAWHRRVEGAPSFAASKPSYIS
ncbi:MAG: hypothetical protein U0166_03710 [Acidobacteriota bacterium]